VWNPLGAPYQMQWHSPESDPRICAKASLHSTGRRWFLSLRSFPGMQHAAARHVVFFTSSPQNCTGVFNAAEEAEVCSGPENYGRNPDPSPVRCIRRPVPYPLLQAVGPRSHADRCSGGGRRVEGHQGLRG
jgi:hypothetical protein